LPAPAHPTMPLVNRPGAKWTQPPFNKPPKHYRGCLDKTRMAMNPTVDYELSAAPQRPEDFMYQTYLRTKIGKNVKNDDGMLYGVHDALDKVAASKSKQMRTDHLKAAVPDRPKSFCTTTAVERYHQARQPVSLGASAIADVAAKRHWQLEQGLIKYGNELEVNMGSTKSPWPSDVPFTDRPAPKPKEEHFAYTTTSNLYGAKAHQAKAEKGGAALGNKFTNSYNGFKYVDGGLLCKRDGGWEMGVDTTQHISPADH
jgi:hypothetical protein